MFDWSGEGWARPVVRPAVMGVVNVTPDSFSDGGRWFGADAAVAHGLALVAAGADLLDVGGESTRPGAGAVVAADEVERVLPVVRRLVTEAGVPVSVDTAKAFVAGAAIDAGASIVNDVTAGRDPEMFGVVAARGVGYVAMHMRGEPRTMQEDPFYDDVVREVSDFLAERLAAAVAAGIPRSAIAVDPGMGFGKTTAHNLALLAHLDHFVGRFDVPVMLGTSRKRFLGEISDSPEPIARDDATLATTVWAAELGVSVVRVHDVAGAARVRSLLDAVRAAA
ncbi:MAG: dihydropteroate synthase [Actinomycetes bacterium]